MFVNYGREFPLQQTPPFQASDTMFGCLPHPADADVNSSFVGPSPLVFSHLEPTTTDPNGFATDTNSVSGSFHSGLEQSPGNHCSHSSRSTTHRQTESENMPTACEQEVLLLNQLQSLTVSSPASCCDTLKTHDHRFGPNADSPVDLNVAASNSAHLSDRAPTSTNIDASSHLGQWAWSCGSYGNGRCRDEALGVGYVDDVTVDDLAGYFDQMLHLPKPMSEMAQLMYT